MYGEADYFKAAAGRKRALTILLLVTGTAFVAIVAGMIFRLKPLAFAAAGLGGCAAYGWGALKLAPWNAYVHFLQEMRSGLRRDSEGAFVSAAEDSRTVDGISVHDVLIDGGGDVPLLFYWDDEKPRPSFQPGQRLKITAFGKFITACEEAGQG